METTRLSSKGQIVIPKSLRERFNWEVGTEFTIFTLEDGIFLKLKRPLPATSVEDVAGCLPYSGSPVSLQDMEEAIRKGVEEGWG